MEPVMFLRKHCLRAFVIATIVLAASFAWALGHELGETKEQLRLKYDVSVYDHGTGRVTVTFTLEDEGRLKPLSSVDLHFPSKDQHAGGGHMSDLTVSLAMSKADDGKQTARIHLKKEFAEQAELQLKTWHLDGHHSPRTWYYHNIPIAKYMKAEGPKKN
jgi:hypothetical protein